MKFDNDSFVESISRIFLKMHMKNKQSDSSNLLRVISERNKLNIKTKVQVAACLFIFLPSATSQNMTCLIWAKPSYLTLECRDFGQPSFDRSV